MKNISNINSVKEDDIIQIVSYDSEYERFNMSQFLCSVNRAKDALSNLLYHCTTENGVDRSAFSTAIDEAKSALNELSQY